MAENTIVVPEEPKVEQSVATDKKKQRMNITISAISNLSIGYNLTCISLVLDIMGDAYGTDISSSKNYMAAACFAGAILGQLTFGYIGDVIGRSKGLYLTQILSIIGAIGSAASFQWGPITPFMMVAFWRFILGVGVGGGYPLTAVLATESSHSQSKGFVGAFVFSMQGLAVVVSPLTMYILLLCFQNMEDPYAWVYRIALCICSFLPLIIPLVLGAVPGLITLPFKTHETSKKPSEKTPTDEAIPEQPKISTWQLLKQPKILSQLIGTMGTWMMADLIFYGTLIFSYVVVHEVFGDQETHIDTALHQTILACIGLPGYYIACFIMDKIGKKILQLQGFLMVSIIYVIIGLFMKSSLPPFVLLLLYGLSFFFLDVGPNTTAFLLPSDTFEPEVRATLNGISAAGGKVGAVLGTFVLPIIQDQYGSSVIMYICSGCSILGFLLTLFFVHNDYPKCMKKEKEDVQEPLIQPETAQVQA